MEEKSMIGTDVRKNALYRLGEDMQNLLNIVQLLEVSLCNAQEEGHILRTVNIIHKMVRNIIDEDLTGING